jgi:apolipoprotein D and lipocalin family protein
MPYKKILFWSIGVIGTVDMLLFRGMSSRKTGEFPTVAHVDIDRYMGKWYEIARYPVPFEKKCSATTAEYTLRPNGKITVVNSCREGAINGPVRTTTGTVWVTDKNSNARFRVQMFWPFAADSWIFDLGQNYEYTVTGDPKGKGLWIFSRTPQMDETKYQEVVGKLKSQGHETWKIVRTPQPKIP